MTRTDAARISLNLILAVAQMAAAFLLFRDGFQTAQGPYPTPGPTPIVPAGYAFVIWMPIFIGCIAYALYQALPGNWSSPLFREIGWLTAFGFLACALWSVAAKYGPVLLTVPLLLCILIGVLAGLALASGTAQSRTAAAFWLVLGPLGLYAGWATVALFANASEVLPSYGFQRFGLDDPWWTILLLAAATATALFGLWLTQGNLFYAGAVIWALVAVIVANAVRNPDGVAIVAAAAGGAVVIVAASIGIRSASI